MRDVSSEREAETRLRPLIDEGLVTGFIWAREDGKPILLIGVSVPTNVREPDFGATRFEDVERRIALACKDLLWRFSPVVLRRRGS